MGDDDEDDEGQADDKLDDRKLEEERATIKKLQSEQARKLEQKDRLNQKKHALTEELEQRKKHIEDLKKQADSKKGHQDTGSSKSEEKLTDTIRQKVRDRLQENIPTWGDQDEQGDGEEEDEEDAKDEGGGGEDAGADVVVVHHTVLVSYFAPDQGADESNFHLTLRIDKDTTLEGFHRDCCVYWGCSPAENLLCKFDKERSLKVLWTDAKDYPNADKDETEKFSWESQVAGAEIPPLQSQDILDNTEESHLFLVPRDSYAEFKNAELKRMDQQDTKAQNTPDQASGQDEEDHHGMILQLKSAAFGKPTLMRRDEPWIEAFAYWFKGVHRMLRDHHRAHPGERRHPWSHHSLSEFVFLGMFIFFSFTAMQLRFEFDTFSLTRGVKGPLVTGVAGESLLSDGKVMNFKMIERHADFWDWLGGSFSYQIFNNASTLRKTFKPVGFIRMRQQRSRRKQCDRSNIPLNLAAMVSAQCYYPDTIDDHEDTARIVIDGEWLQTPGVGRYSTSRPLIWDAGRPSAINLLGEVQSAYGPSGYSVDYDVNLGDETDIPAGATFVNDLTVLRQNWIDSRTRAVAIDVTLANYHLAGIVSAVFFLEFSASGGVHHQQVIRAARLSRSGAADHARNLDVCRWLYIVLYLLVYNVQHEVKKYQMKKRIGLSYVVSFKGFLDESMVGLFLAIQLMRHDLPLSTHRFPPDPRSLTAFYSYSQHAYTTEQLEVAEAILLYIALIRFALLMRFFTQVFRFLQTMRRTMNLYLWFIAIFGAVIFGLVFLGNTIWNPYLQAFSTWANSLNYVTLSLLSSVDIWPALEANRTLALVYLAYFFGVCAMLMLPMFLAMAVHSYFEVEMLEGLGKSEQIGWKFNDWMKWALWTPVYQRIYGEADDGGEEDDEEQDDDNDDDDDDDGDDGKGKK